MSHSLPSCETGWVAIYTSPVPCPFCFVWPNSIGYLLSECIHTMPLFLHPPGMIAFISKHKCMHVCKLYVDECYYKLCMFSLSLHMLHCVTAVKSPSINTMSSSTSSSHSPMHDRANNKYNFPGDLGMCALQCNIYYLTGTFRCPGPYCTGPY